MDLTLFHTTLGEPTTEEVRSRSLVTQAAHGCQYREIHNVTPLWAVLEKMVRESETKWYIAQDADMVLDESAVKRLYDRAESASPDVALVCGWLWDDIAKRPILGIKCYRTEAARAVPFRNIAGPDSDQTVRMTETGWRIVLEPEEASTREACVGQHVHGTPERAFRHWFEAVLKQRHTPRHDWIEDVIPGLRIRARSGNPIREAAWLGAVAGQFAPLEALTDHNPLAFREWQKVAKYIQNEPQEIV